MAPHMQKTPSSLLFQSTPCFFFVPEKFLLVLAAGIGITGDGLGIGFCGCSSADVKTATLLVPGARYFGLCVCLTWV